MKSYRIAGLGLLAACALACAGAPTASPPRPSAAHESCRKAMVALDAAPDAGTKDFDGRARTIDEERRAVLASGLLDDDSGTLRTYAKRSEQAAEAVRRLVPVSPEAVQRDLADFMDAMSTFMSRCTAPGCFDVMMLIGGHTMHQPRLDVTLPMLADKLDKVHLEDPKLQAELVKFSAEARKAGESLGKMMSAGDAATSEANAREWLDSLEASRALLRARCKQALRP